MSHFISCGQELCWSSILSVQTHARTRTHTVWNSCCHIPQTNFSVVTTTGKPEEATILFSASHTHTLTACGSASAAYDCRGCVSLEHDVHTWRVTSHKMWGAPRLYDVRTNLCCWINLNVLYTLCTYTHCAHRCTHTHRHRIRTILIWGWVREIIYRHFGAIKWVMLGSHWGRGSHCFPFASFYGSFPCWCCMTTSPSTLVWNISWCRKT